MKTSFLITIIAALLVTTPSCKSKSQKDAEKYMNDIQKTVKENSPAQEEEQKDNKAVPVPEDMKAIVGEWELVKIFPDSNGDHKVDADEEKNAMTNLKDYLKLNADGTCEYTIVKLKGRYEIITKEDGRKRLTMYDRTGAETTSGRYIISVTDKELVINRLMGGSDFEIFKRL